MKEFFSNKCEEFGVSPVIGVILIVAITVIIAAVLGVAVFGFGGMLEESSTGETSVEVSESSNGITVQPISSGYDEDIEVLANNSVIKTIPAGSMSAATINYDNENISTSETKIIVRSGDTVLHETTVNPSDEQYYKDPPNTLSSSDFEVVSKGYNEQSFQDVDISSSRLIGLTEEFEVNIAGGNYNPDDFSYSWSSKYPSYVSVSSTSGNKATYSFDSIPPNNDNFNYVKVTVSTENDSITISYNSFNLDNIIQDVSIVSNGFNEDPLTNINNPNTRFVGSTENFEITGINLHSQLDGHVSNDLSGFDYNWIEKWGGNQVSLKNTNGKKATYSHDNVPSNNDKFNYVRIEISHPDASNQQIFGHNNFRLGKIVQDVTINTNGGRDSDGNNMNYSNGDNRVIGTNETFTFSDLTLHSEVDSVMDNNIGNFNYNWKTQNSNYVSIESTNDDKATYSYDNIPSNNDNFKWVRITNLHHPNIPHNQELSYYKFSLES